MTNDTLRIARTTEQNVDTFIATLNDYTLLLATDTGNLYTKVSGSKMLINPNPLNASYDLPFQKELSFYASNPDNIPLSIGEFIGLCGLTDGTFKLCDPLSYKGEFLGILNRYDSTSKKYVVDLISNLYVEDNTCKIGDTVYIGKIGNQVFGVINPETLDVLYGVGGIVTEVNTINRFGRYTYNGITLQSTYIMKTIENNEVEYFEGYLPFVFPLAKDFVVAVFQITGSGETVVQQVPAPSELKKGCIFYVTNISTDPTNKVRLEVPMGSHIGGGSYFEVKAGETVQFIADRKSRDWQYIHAQGKIPTGQDIKDIITNDGFIKSLLIQNDDSSVSVGAKSIQFRSPFTVGNNGTVAEVNLSDKIITVADDKGTEFMTDSVKFINGNIQNNGGTAEITLPTPKTLTVENSDSTQSFNTNLLRFADTGVNVDHKPNGDIEVSGIVADITFVDSDNKEFTSNKIQSLDKSIRVSNLGGVADLSKGISEHNEGMLAFLGNDELINSEFGKSKLYFSDVRVKGGTYVYQNLQNKSFVIQDTDPQDDPNVSGGTTFIVAMYYEPNQDTENTLAQDGFVDIELVDENDIVINDIYGNPMGVRMDYKTGEELKPMLYVGEVQAKAYREVHMKITPAFANEEIISIGANSCICLQSISKDESSGLALLSFMAYTGFRLGFDVKYYGFNSLNLSQYFIFPEPLTFVPSNTTMSLGDNTQVNFVNPAKVEITDNSLVISDNGSDLPIFSITKTYDKLDSYFIGGKDYKVTATLTDKDSAFVVGMLEYIGTENIAPVPKVESYNNGVPVFTNGWSQIDSMFISEDVVVGEHKQSKDFLIPDSPKGIAVVMYPQDSQIPTTLKLKDLEGDITPWFNKVVITNNSHISEEHLVNLDTFYKGVVGTPKGMAGYRYTVNNVDTKIPAGVVSGKGKLVINDNSWHDAGSNDPNKTQGDYKFLSDGKVTMSYTAQCYNEQYTINQIHIWIAKVNADGTFTEVPNSRIATIIEGNRVKPKLVSSPSFNFDVKANDSYRVFAKSDKSDGFFMESKTDGVSLFESTIEFKTISETEKGIMDELNDLKITSNEVRFMDGDKEVHNKVLEYDIRTGKMKVVDR